MRWPRRLRRELLEGAIFFAAVSAGGRVAVAQTPPPPATPVGSEIAGAKAKSLERADVVRFRKRVEAALNSSGADKGVWGVLVTDAASGTVLYALHPDSYFAPASDAKLFTTAIALATLGPDFRVRTAIGASGTLGNDGVLNGDLILIGGGDANLSNRKFPYEKKVERDGPPEKALADLADAVVARGVKQIAGDVIADDSLFALERFPSGWTIDDMVWSYGAPVSAIAINDNSFTLEVRPGGKEGDLAVLALEPALDFYMIQNTVRTGASGSEEKLAIAREPGSRTFHLSGALPRGAEPRKLLLAIEEPAEYAAALLARLLEARGVQIHGAVRARHAPAASAPDPPSMPPTILAEHTSPPLAADVLVTNKMSLNLHAELLLRLAAYQKAGATTAEDALKFAADFFTKAGIADGDVVMSDASGLSRKDLVTPSAVVQILRYAATQPWGEVYRSSLPVAGEDGTLSDRMKNTAAMGRIFAKTGTVEHVHALSGYATSVRGAHLVFSILENNDHLHAQQANAVIDAIAVAMVEELGPASAATEPRK
jgi:D-alanyl-D-alanine carboxypeptidase/D-alanyl-D-alanine-endopeptidase (penicillin-binding protein 4)